MKLTNGEIYTYAKNLMEMFENKEQKFPVKVGFYLQKNKDTLMSLAQDIDSTRIEIVQNYGELDEEKQQYIIPPENVDIVTKELDDLFNLEQEVQIYKINIDNFDDNLSISVAQMETLMFMID